MLPLLLVACVGRRLGGVLCVGAALLLGRSRYRRHPFDMAQGADDSRIKKARAVLNNE
jgi:hypothetical protein